MTVKNFSHLAMKNFSQCIKEICPWCHNHFTTKFELYEEMECKCKKCNPVYCDCITVSPLRDYHVCGRAQEKEN